MTNLEALHAAILANPEADDPRLMYADALDERGQEGDAERAEFVRVQCELSKRPDCGHGATNTVYLDGSCPVCPRRHRERDLIKANAHTWFDNRGTDFVVIDYHDAHEEPPSCLVMGRSRPPRQCSYARLSRGFIESVTCTATDFLAHADELVWRPGQTVECLECGGSGYTACDRKDCPYCAPDVCGNPPECTACGGVGHVPRPCPPTAQPITRVTLTTEPNEREFGTIERIDWESGAVKYYRWLGITFDIDPGLVGAVAARSPEASQEADVPQPVE